MKNLKVSLAGALALSSIVSAQVQTPGDEPIAEVVITASRSEQLRERAAVVVDVISRAQIAQSGASTVADLLDDLGGVSVSRSLGRSGVRTTLDIGYMGEAGGQNVLIMIDGQRLNSLDMADAALAQLPIAAIERVEVRKANAGALYGDRAQGGVINIITRKDNAKEVGVTVGSFNAQKLDTYLGFKSGKVHGSVALMSAQSDGFRAHNRSSQDSLHARLSLTEDWGSVRLQARTFEEDAQLPGAITPAQFVLNPRSKGTDPSTSQREGQAIGLRFDKMLGEGRGFSLDLSAQEVEDFSNFPTYFYSSKITNTRQSFNPEWRSPWLQGTVLIGAELSSAESNTDSGKQVTQQSQSVYVMGTQAVDQNTLLEATLRSQTARNHFQSAVGQPQTASDLEQTALSVALRQQIDAQTTLRGGLLRGFRLPNADELYYFHPSTFALLSINPDIDPMTTREVFVHFAQNIRNGKWDVHYRNIRAKGEIGYQYNCGTLSGSNVSCNTNLYDSGRDVLSLNGQWQLAPGWSLSAGMDWVHAQIESGDQNGKRIPLTPKTSARLSLERSLGKYAVVASTRYRSDMVQASDSAAFYPLIPARNVVDLGVRTLRVRPWSVSAWVRNVGNKRYYDYATAGTVYPAEGRSVSLSAKYTF